MLSNLTQAQAHIAAGRACLEIAADADRERGRAVDAVYWRDRAGFHLAAAHHYLRKIAHGRQSIVALVGGVRPRCAA